MQPVSRVIAGAGQALALLAITAAERRSEIPPGAGARRHLRQGRPQVLTLMYAPLAVSRACPEATDLTAVPAA